MADNRNASLADMLRSIFVIGLLILALAGLGVWFQVRPETKVQAVDYATAAKAARGVSSFKILTPSSLPNGWKATTVRYAAGAKGSWHLGVLTDDGKYVGLEQTGAGILTALQDYSPDTTPRGTSAIGGFTWQVRQSTNGETTLVREEGGITIIVTGTAAKSVLETYAASLTDH